MENVVLKVALYGHNGVVLSPLCLLYLCYHLWRDCGYKCFLSLRTGTDERGLWVRKTGVERDNFVLGQCFLCELSLCIGIWVCVFACVCIHMSLCCQSNRMSCFLNRGFRCDVSSMSHQGALPGWFDRRADGDGVMKWVWVGFAAGGLSSSHHTGCISAMVKDTVRET